MTTFSVIVPFRNRRGLLPRMLRSLVAQTMRPLQVVLVDNASTDDSADVCRRFIKAHDEADGLSFVMTSEPQLGANRARNRGRCLATGEWLSFFDSDDEMSPTFLADVAEVIAAKGEACKVVAAATRMVFPNGRTKVRQVFYPKSDKAASNLTHIAQDQILCGMIATQGFVVRAAYLDEVGGWNSQLSIWQDWELGLRLILGGGKICWIKQRAYHRIHQHADSITGKSFSQHLAELRQTLLCVEKHLWENEAQLSRVANHQALLQTLAARCVILAGHFQREGKRQAAKDWYDAAYDYMAPHHARLCHFLFFYVSHGGVAAWRIVRWMLA